MAKKQKSLARQNRHLPTKIILIAYTLLTAFPLFISIINAFRTREDIVQHPLSFRLDALTLDGLRNAFELMKFPQALKNNIIVLLISLAIMVVFGSLMGFAVALVRSRTLNVSYTVAVLVITIPFQAIMIPLVILLKWMNLLNTYLGSSLIFVATSLPIVVFLYTGFMRSLPRELCEAAVVDGCGIWRTYLSIYMPLLKTVTGTVVIIRGTGIWNDLLVCLISLSDPKKSTMVFRLYSFVSNKFNRWDLVFGSSLLVSIPIIILFILLQKAFVQGVVAGAVKG